MGYSSERELEREDEKWQKKSLQVKLRYNETSPTNIV